MKFGFTRREIKPTTKEQDEDFRNRLEEMNVGAKDKIAMVFAAFLTIVLPCVLVLAGLSLLGMWVFGVFG